jgi:hypothetical protein
MIKKTASSNSEMIFSTHCIKIDLTEIGCELDSPGSGNVQWQAVMNIEMNLHIPHHSKNLKIRLTTSSQERATWS